MSMAMPNYLFTECKMFQEFYKYFNNQPNSVWIFCSIIQRGHMLCCEESDGTAAVQTMRYKFSLRIKANVLLSLVTCLVFTLGEFALHCVFKSDIICTTMKLSILHFKSLLKASLLSITCLRQQNYLGSAGNSHQLIAIDKLMKWS